MNTLSPVTFASTVESLIQDQGVAARVTLVSRKSNGKTSIKFETSDRDHWINLHESLLNAENARAIAPNVALGLREF